MSARPRQHPPDAFRVEPVPVRDIARLKTEAAALEAALADASDDGKAVRPRLMLASRRAELADVQAKAEM